MNNANWIIVNGKSQVGHATFPLAYRQAYFLIENEKKAGRPVLPLMKTLKILGPPIGGKPRATYTWAAASDLARSNGLLTLNETLNGKEFKGR